MKKFDTLVMILYIRIDRDTVVSFFERNRFIFEFQIAAYKF